MQTITKLLLNYTSHQVLHSDKHIVTSAPTGSGKTAIFEMAIIRLLTQSKSSFSSFKIVYGIGCCYAVNLLMFLFICSCSYQSIVRWTIHWLEWQVWSIRLDLLWTDRGHWNWWLLWITTCPYYYYNSSMSTMCVCVIHIVACTVFKIL